MKKIWHKKIPETSLHAIFNIKEIVAKIKYKPESKDFKVSI